MNDDEKIFDQLMVSDSNCGFFFFEPQLDHYSALPIDRRSGFTSEHRAGRCNRLNGGSSSQTSIMIMTFDDAFRSQLRNLLMKRRDVRRFRTEPLPVGTLERLIELACLAPSVGLSQPWRFVIVDDSLRRRAILEDFEMCNANALKSYTGNLATKYVELKLAGLQEAPSQLAVFADRGTDIGHGLGRKTMPETAEYSVVAAVFTMWLAARAEGIGMGWISILDPKRVNAILEVPATWRLIGYFCLGYPKAESTVPELESEGWEYRRHSESFVLRR